MAAGGYPGDYEKHKVHYGLGHSGEAGFAVAVFHAGTVAARGWNEFCRTAGGFWASQRRARRSRRRGRFATARWSAIHFDGGFYRRDIGARATHVQKGN